MSDKNTNEQYMPHGHHISTRASSVLLSVLGVMFVCLFVWASIAEVDRVTRGEGRIVSREKNNFAQHYEGGIITQVLIEEGQIVEKDQPLIRIENSFAQSELAKSLLELHTKKIQKERLIAEEAGTQFRVADDDLRRDYPEIVAHQEQVFKRRQQEYLEGIGIIEDQIKQKEFSLSELRTRLKNTRKEAALIEESVESLRVLEQKGAVARNDLLDKETKLQQVKTLIADIEFQIPRTRSALEEVKGRRREAMTIFQSEVADERTDIEFSIAKLEESIDALNDRKDRFDVLAPISGTINKIFVNNIGGVVQPGQHIAEIVPLNGSIQVEARLKPRDRARVWLNMLSIVKVSAYEFATYGGLQGRIVEISPDALKDENGDVYFRVRIEADADSFGPDRPVVPGMLAEVDIITGKQTILDYLLTPIFDMKEKAFRE